MRVYKSKYPWEQWLKPGSKRKLTWGKHFDCTLQTLRVNFYHRAVKQGVKVHITEVDAETLHIEVELNGKG